MTQIEAARTGMITPAIRRVAEKEGREPEEVRKALAAGHLVIPSNVHHLAAQYGGSDGGKLDPIGIGRLLRTKVNANLGTSPDASCKDEELIKMNLSIRYGADAVMDLSTGGSLDEIRTYLIANAPVPLGTVPIYEMTQHKPVEELTCEDMLATIEKQARQGVDFFTIHAGLLREHLPLAEARLGGIVSRGGSLLAKWMTHHNRQNPMYEIFDDLCAIMREFDVAFSLGDGLRPGCLADATDKAQLAELHVLGELVLKAREQGCQVIVEGPGHIPFDQIEENMRLEAQLCDGAPFYVLGPIVTDVAPGYDHITSAIGATAAATYGASFLCYVTPAEHLALPGPVDVREGVIAHRIAAHAGDVARGLPGARDWDDRMSRARTRFDWRTQLKIAMDSERAREIRKASSPDDDFCSMCGKDWCAVRRSKEVFQETEPKPESTEDTSEATESKAVTPQPSPTGD
ncbi:MAG: phosphomethylpyrimidine synthase ThiC [Candidatus Eisenbacteria sp.]|nr:phosphomethylpyrimidine synthase ThiC [Candidatus Eisenbacteria bacterium]